MKRFLSYVYTIIIGVLFGIFLVLWSSNKFSGDGGIKVYGDTVMDIGERVHGLYLDIMDNPAVDEDEDEDVDEEIYDYNAE